jgi:hypothetical protein
MQKIITQTLLAVVMVALVVPESIAKRLGGGRSFGRSSQMSRQRAAPPAIARSRPAPTPVRPGIAPRPQQNAARPPFTPGGAGWAQRRSGSGLGGVLGGTLLGLGLGSVLSSGHAQDAANQEAARAEAARQEAAAQEQARLDAQRQDAASGTNGQGASGQGASGQGATGSGGDETPGNPPPASGNW